MIVQQYRGFTLSEDLNGNWHVTCQHAGMHGPIEHAMFRTSSEAEAWVDFWHLSPSTTERMLYAERSERLERGE